MLVFCSSCSMPSTAFIGVRISWLILATKSDLARPAASASSLASSSAAWAARLGHVGAAADPDRDGAVGVSLRQRVMVEHAPCAVGAPQPAIAAELRPGRLR